jgi:hypothetical protein
VIGAVERQVIGTWEDSDGQACTGVDAARYREHVHHYVIPLLGNSADVYHTAHVQTALLGIAAGKTPRSRQLAWSTLDSIPAALRTRLGDAALQGLIATKGRPSDVARCEPASHCRCAA